MCCFKDTKSYWKNVIYFLLKPSLYLLIKSLKLVSCWMKCFGDTGLRVTVLKHDRIVTVQRRGDFLVVRKDHVTEKKNVCVYACV